MVRVPTDRRLRAGRKRRDSHKAVAETAAGSRDLWSARRLSRGIQLWRQRLDAQA